MSKFIILTDSSCDLPAKLAEKYEIASIPLSTEINGKSYRNHLDGSGVDVTWFYNQLREKQNATTSAANVSDFLGIMEEQLSQGNDVLYLGFSSGLSSTYSAGVMAAEELSAKYPERKILTVDTLAASLGQGLLVYLCAKEREKGRSIEEVRDYAEALKLKIDHWFTVDDLFHLKRGGRVSAATAVVGSMLGIKPVMHVDDEGHLTKVETVRGRRASIERLAEKARELGTQLKDQIVFISHGDCLEDAETLKSCMQNLGVREFVINHVGPVIGAHSGPGTLALFFVGSQR